MLRRHIAITLVVLAGALLGACKDNRIKQPEAAQGAQQGQGASLAASASGALAADTAYGAGVVPVAVLEVSAKLDVPGLVPNGAVDEAVKAARAGSVFRQRMVIAEDRGKLVFQDDDLHIPKGTELRLNPAQKKYVLTAPKQKQYWAMSGADIGNLLEGGPTMKFSNFSISFADSTETATIAGLKTARTDARIGCAWTLRTREGKRGGQLDVTVRIWHTKDPKLKPAWGRMMVDFLTFFLQDEGGDAVVSQLKDKVGFPMKWSIQMVNQGQVKAKGEQHPTLVSAVQSLVIQDAPKSELASPPAGFTAATGPYEFGEGGQTASESLIKQLPAQKGTPPSKTEELR